MPSLNPPVRPARLPLGRTNRRLSFERRIRLWLTVLALPGLSLAAAFTYERSRSIFVVLVAAAAVSVVWAVACSFLFEQITRPLQTLSNVVAALREDDFSFRARGSRRGDSLGDLALEVNALASTLQQQRTVALDAVTMVERALTVMRSPVLAFDQEGHLRLFNEAAGRAFSLSQPVSIGRNALELSLSELLEVRDETLYPGGLSSGDGPRWSVGRVTFRLNGLPHTLFVLSDVATVLREEESTAWQRLIRVLGHEINNSLTPIKSIAGSLRAQFTERTVEPADLLRGLTIIEDRATSLNRFLQAYQRLLRLPPPSRLPVPIGVLLAHVAQLEMRLAVKVEAGPALTIACDPDQLQQALINLVQNAVDAALSENIRATDHVPTVTVSWSGKESGVSIMIVDNGEGVANPSNLFVPFYTTKPNGSGIGLVLAQQIAQLHGGNVTLSPRHDQRGTRVELRLPLR